MERLANTSNFKIGRLNKYIFFAEKVNSRHSFAFTSSNFIIDYNLRLLQSSKSQAILGIAFETTMKCHLLNFGRYIIVLRVGNSNLDREMYFVDYQLKESQILLMDKIFHRKELTAILRLRQKMMETYDGREKNIATVASIYN